MIHLKLWNNSLIYAFCFELFVCVSLSTCLQKTLRIFDFFLKAHLAWGTICFELFVCVSLSTCLQKTLRIFDFFLKAHLAWGTIWKIISKHVFAENAKNFRFFWCFFKHVFAKNAKNFRFFWKRTWREGQFEKSSLCKETFRRGPHAWRACVSDVSQQKCTF